MTLPNKLTLSRIFTSPLVFLVWFFPVERGWAPMLGAMALAVLFIVSEITDVMDGHIARTRGQVSDIGKLMDPFSDVFLRITFFVCFIGAGLMPLWAFIIIVWRELGIMFVRMLLAKEGTALAANKGGKLKSLLYALSSFGGVFVLVVRTWNPGIAFLSLSETISRYLFILAAAAAIVSFFSYLRIYIASDTHRRFMNE